MSVPPAEAPGDRRAASGALFALAGAIGFSFKAILIKLAYAQHPVDPLTLLTLRLAYSAPFYAAIAWWWSRDVPAIARRDWMIVAVLGFLGYYLSSYCDFLGLQYVSAALERMVLFLYPTIVVLLSAIFLRRPITRRTLAALLLSYGGIVLVFQHDLRMASDAGKLALGAALVFGSALTYAIYLVGAGPVVARIGSARFTAYAMLASTVFVGAHFALAHPAAASPAGSIAAALELPRSVHLITLAMAIVSTVLPTLLVSEAIRRIGSDRTALLGASGPLATLVFGVLLLGESIGALQLVGAALVIAGVTVVTARR